MAAAEATAVPATTTGIRAAQRGIKTGRIVGRTRGGTDGRADADGARSCSERWLTSKREFLPLLPPSLSPSSPVPADNTHTYVRKNTHARPPVSVPRRARRPATVGSGLRMRTIEGVSFTPKVNFSRNLSFVSTGTVGRPHRRILHCMATQRARPTENPSPRRVGFTSQHNTAGGRAEWTSARRARAGAGSGARFV